MNHAELRRLVALDRCRAKYGPVLDFAGSQAGKRRILCALLLSHRRAATEFHGANGSDSAGKETGWYARQDLNLRPFAPEANALSS